MSIQELWLGVGQSETRNSKKVIHQEADGNFITLTHHRSQEDTFKWMDGRTLAEQTRTGRRGWRFLNSSDWPLNTNVAVCGLFIAEVCCQWQSRREIYNRE